ncbi:NAD(P)/FAD-dependent oxidoreductase [Variovorax ginsengisoli]|uniref:3-phenylpropionate/trans-cinnamate dioxygenase ferredoxin reductase subunit n=1 Tax=Variovorax ginsengisoli TaxID=363844 RepID=A0ABT9SAP1_9BURK|nr:FAD-dependent oxidoreductase [Variovorax ginsengisoli]MDP9900979.1 3-phenylpropionate/trans-cinnamate dioxygenase ferredoxin reductase subunit [Variovorax ginsengisoli]
MQSSDTLLIVGAGSAGSELAVSARQLGWPGPIVLLGEEHCLPYHRPPLSKAFLHGTATSDSLTMRPQEAYEKANIDVRLGARVASIDRAAKRVHLHDGSTLAYGKLALCTGGRPRPLVADGLAADAAPGNLHVLRTQADAQAIRDGLAEGTQLVVIGGGYVGLEVAASARKLGASVTVLEAQPRVLARVTGEALSAFYTAIHREAGVDIRTGVAVQRIECDERGRVRAVICSDGARLPADCVVVGVGMLPNAELAAAAGLAVDGGIVVDALSVTSDPDIVAAGDCTVHDHALYARRVRLESVPNALEQARAAASALCGKPKPNHAVPWFWSDQYDLKLQMVGLSAGFEACVLRGAPQERNFIAFYLRDGCVIAADAVNRPADFMVAKRLVAAACRIDADQLADASVPLKQLLLTAVSA